MTQFAVETTAPASAVRVSPLPVLGAALFALLSIAIGAFAVMADRSGDIVVAAAGYFSGSFATAACVVVHRVLVQRAARNAWYSPRYSLDRLASSALVVGLLAGAFNAYLLATEVAKR